MDRRVYEIGLCLFLMLLLCALALLHRGSTQEVSRECAECQVCPVGFATLGDMVQLADENQTIQRRLDVCQETIKRCVCE